MSYYDMSEELAEYILRLGTDSDHLKEMSVLSRELSFVEEAPPLIVKKAIQEFCQKIDENSVKRDSVIDDIITKNMAMSRSVPEIWALPPVRPLFGYADIKLMGRKL